MNDQRTFRPRVIPVLLLNRGLLYKTRGFGKPTYIGDPRNAVRIFNEKGADEIALLDIGATPEQREPDYDTIAEIVSEAFMPLAYGGGITNVDQAKRILDIGVEKIVLGSSAAENPSLVERMAAYSGSQSVTVCIDVKVGLLGRRQVVTHSGRKKTGLDPVALAKQVAAAGAGEIVIQSVDRDGAMQGYDLALVRQVVEAVDIPVVALGGAGRDEDLARAVHESGASAVAAGAMFVFQGAHRAVLISYPEDSRLQMLMSDKGEK